MTTLGYGEGGLEGVLLWHSDPDHVFEAASKRAARDARDVMIPDTSQFDDDGSLAIIVRFRDREIWQVRRDGEWRDVCVMDTDADE